MTQNNILTTENTLCLRIRIRKKIVIPIAFLLEVINIIIVRIPYVEPSFENMNQMRLSFDQSGLAFDIKPNLFMAGI